MNTKRRLFVSSGSLRNKISPLILATSLFGLASARAQLTITPIWDSSITSLSNASAVEAAITAGINEITSEITSPRADTVSIKFQTTNTGLADSSTYFYDIDYSTYLADLKNNPNGLSAVQTTAINSMPTGSTLPTSLNSATQVKLTISNLVAVGETNLANQLLAGTGGLNGTVEFNLPVMNVSRTGNLVTGNYDLQSAVMHEMDEILGIGGQGSTLDGDLNSGNPPTTVGTMDLFRYSASGKRSFNYDTTTPAYFSIDGGATNLVYFNQQAGHPGGADYADWGNPAGTRHGNSPGYVQDAFGTPYGGSGYAPDYSSVELTAFQAVGYNLVTVASSKLYWTGGGGALWSNNQNWGVDVGGTFSANIPAATTDVVFSAVGASFQYASLLDQNLTIHSLTINDSSAVNITSYSGGPYTLTIAGGSGTGIDVQTNAGLFTMNANVKLGGTSDTINVSNTAGAVINGTISGSNGLFKTGTGTLTFGAVNNYTGGTAIYDGTLRLAVDNALPTTDPILVNAQTGQGHAILDLAGHNQILAGVTFVAPGGSRYSIVDVNGGVLALTGDVYLVDNNSAAGNGGAAYIQDSAGGGAIEVDNVDRTFYIASQNVSAQDLVISPTIKGSGGIVVVAVPSSYNNAEGGLVLGSANSYTGATTVALGRLTTMAAGALPSTTDLILGTAGSGTANGDVDLHGNSQTINSLNLASGNTGGTSNYITSSTGSATLTISSSNMDSTFGGLITGPLSLVKDGSSFLTLNAANTYTGSTTIYNGQARIGVDNAFPTTTTMNLNRADGTGQVTLNLQGHNQTLAALKMVAASGGLGNTVETNGGTLTLTGDLTVSDNSTASGAGTTSYILDSHGGGKFALGTGSHNFNIAGQNTNAHDLEIDAAITGAGSLVINASPSSSTSSEGGVFFGAANSYQGNTVVAQGRLTTLVAGALPTTTDLVLGTANSTFSGDVDLYGANQTVNSINVASGNTGGAANTITSSNGSATLTVSSSGLSSTFSGVISGSVALTKAGAASSTLTLTGANTYTGATTVNGGTLAVNGSLAADSAVTVNSGGRLAGTGSVLGAVTVNSGGKLSPGSGTLPGTLTLGSLVLNPGADSTFRLGTPGAGDQVNVTGALTVGGTLDITALPGFGVGDYVLFTAGGLLTNNGFSAINGLPSGFTASAISQNVGGNQLALLVLAGVGQYWDGTGPINDGTVTGGTGNWSTTANNWTTSNGTSNSTWQSGTAIFGNNSGNVTLTSPISAQGLIFNTDGYVINGTATLTLTGTSPAISVSNPSTRATISTKIAGTAGLTANGRGRLILLNSGNTYSGPTTISGGTLQVGLGTTAGSLGTGAVNIINGGTLEIDNITGNTLSHAITNGVGGVGTLNMASTNTDTISAPLTDGVAGQLALAQNSTATTILTNAGNTFTGGTTINGGTMQVGTTAAAGSIGTGTIVLGTGTLSLVNLSGGQLSNRIAYTGPGTANLNVSSTTNVTLSGLISGGTSTSFSLNKSGTGILTLTGIAVYAGPTNVTAGTLQVGNGTSGSLSQTSAVNVSGTGALALNLGGTSPTFIPDIKLTSSTAAVNFVQAGLTNVFSTISGSGGLNQNGAGRTVLIEPESYTGPTKVNAGTLEVDYGLAKASTVTVNSGGTLSGQGEIQGAVTVNSGGTLSGGNVANGPGVLTVGSLVLNAGATTTLRLTTPGIIAGPGDDMICSNSTATIGGALNITPLSGFGFGTYPLFVYSGKLTYNGFTSINGLAGFSASISTSTSGEVDLVVTRGATLYWDGTGKVNDSVVTGGSGTWNLTSKNWTTDSGGSTNTNWQYYTADFRGAAGTVTLGGPISTQGLIFETSGYVIGGTNPLTLTGAAPSINISNNTAIATISAKISGTTGLNMSGLGTLILTNTANNYTGGTVISTGGTLQIGSTTAGSVGPGTINVSNGSTLRLTNVSGNQLSNNVSNNITGVFTTPGTILVNATTPLTLSGALTDGTAGILALTQNGTGTTTLLGTGNTYSGATTISKGTLAIGTSVFPGSIGTGPISIGSNATLSLLNVHGNVLPNAISNSGGVGTVSINTLTTMTLSGALTNGSSVLTVTKSGVGTAIFTGAETYTGATNITGGTLQIGDGTNGNLNGGADVDLSGSGVLALDLADQGFFAPRVKLNAATAAVKAIGSGTNTFTQAISGTGVFIQAGTGTTILSNVNTYTGATTVSTGTLQVDGILAAGSAVTVASAGTLTGLGIIHGKVTLNGGTIDLNSGEIGGTLTSTGGTWSGQGKVDGAITASSGAFNLTGTLSAPAGFNLTGGTLAGTGGVLLGNLTYTSSTSSVFSGGIQDIGSTKTKLTMNKAASKLTVTANLGYSGATTVSAGTLQIGDGTTGNLLSTSGVTVSGSGVLALDIPDGAQFDRSVNLSAATASVNAVQSGRTTLISGITGTGGFNQTGSGRTELGPAQSYTGPTKITAGALQVDTSLASAVTVSGSGTLAGGGTMSKGITLSSGGTVAPGVGSLGDANTTMHASSLIWNGGAALTLEVSAVSADEVILTGALTKGTAGAFTLNLVDAGLGVGTTPVTLTLMTFASTNFSLGNFTLDLPTGFTGTLVETSKSLQIQNLSNPNSGHSELPAGSDAGTLSLNDPASRSSQPADTFTTDPTMTPMTAPEPGSATLLAFGGSALLGYRRRRNGGK